jgi:hypothetical protein
MSITVAELSAAVDQWEAEHENDPAYEDYQGSFWDAIIEEKIELPGLGLVEQVSNGVFLEFGDKVQFVIISIGDQFFRATGWYDSWDGYSEWDGPLTEVKEVEVVTKEWQVKE